MQIIPVKGKKPMNPHSITRSVKTWAPVSLSNLINQLHMGHWVLCFHMNKSLLFFGSVILYQLLLLGHLFLYPNQVLICSRPSLTVISSKSSREFWWSQGKVKCSYNMWKHLPSTGWVLKVCQRKLYHTLIFSTKTGIQKAFNQC